MRLRETDFTFPLEAEMIDQAADKVAEFLRALSLDRKEALRLRLSAEEVLLAWQGRFGDRTEARLVCFSRLGQPMVRLELKEELFDPLQKDENTSEWSQILLSRLETVPLFSYTRGTNLVTFKIRRKKANPFVLLLIGLLAGAALGFGGWLLPTGFTDMAVSDWIEPICNAYLEVFCLCGIPLIFLSVALGIFGVGDLSTFGRIGGRMIRHFMLVLVLCTVLTVGICLPCFNLFIDGGSRASLAVGDLRDLMLGWLPTDIVLPFTTRNAMQIVLLGVLFGVAFLKLDPTTRPLAGALSSLNEVLLLVAEWLTKLLPIFVCLTVTKSFWSRDLTRMISMWRPWVVTIGLQILLLLGQSLVVCRKYRVGLGKLLKKVSSTFLIALGTNSCTASVPENYDCCANKLGIHPNLFGFGIPIGTSVFKPASAIRLAVIVAYLAAVSGSAVSPARLVLAILLSVMLSIAAPAIPGGTLMLCSMLIGPLGLPARAMMPVLATDVFFDAFCTATNQVAVQLALTHQAGTMDLLDRDILRGTGG